ncbi:HAMP domain-containing protein [Leptothrix discophora]|uniref:histidine kinase n=1 Tax=Leptothrix discophora TaxID=89 RepID=A0ABT9FYL9_LEPDI|nr:HAMP domain-containing protein [Leptothrix discophora]MDP4299117.1 HAMP domain-containing protein [Leptothrix discophora]
MTGLPESSPAVASGVPGRPRGQSLRAQAAWALLALLACLAGSALFVSVERSQLDAQLQGLQSVSRHERTLALALAAVETARLDASEDLSQVHPLSPAEAAALQGRARDAPPDLDVYIENCERLFEDLKPWDAGYPLLYRAVEQHWQVLRTAPTEGAWQALRAALAELKADLTRRHDRLVEQREAQAQVYQRQFDAVTTETGLLAAAGLLLLGVPMLLYAGRLARDIGRLESHARGLVGGQRGEPLRVTRRDEVGALMASVNQLAADLAAREQALALDRERRAHDDKMHALAALASGMAHEINNPLAVIGGLAEQLVDEPVADPAAVAAVAAAAREIVAQTRRAAIAAQRLAEAATPLPGDLRWLDLAELMGQAVRLAGHDRRLRQLRFEVTADPALPALHLSAARLQQVLMQLLQAAGEALASRPEAVREPLRIALAPATDDPSQVLLRLPLPGVTGAPALDTCAALAATLGGTLAFAQDDAWVSCITLRLPVDGVVPEGAPAE